VVFVVVVVVVDPSLCRARRAVLVESTRSSSRSCRSLTALRALTCARAAALPVVVVDACVVPDFGACSSQRLPAPPPACVLPPPGACRCETVVVGAFGALAHRRHCPCPARPRP
jgi:hypothetical protein